MASQNDSFDSLNAKQQHNNINATDEIDFVETEGSFGFMVDCDDFLLQSQNHNVSATIDIRGQQDGATAFAEIDKNAINEDFPYFFGDSTNTDNLIWLVPEQNKIHDNSNNAQHFNNWLHETTSLTDNFKTSDNYKKVLPEVDLLTPTSFKEKPMNDDQASCSDAKTHFGDQMTSDTVSSRNFNNAVASQNHFMRHQNSCLTPNNGIGSSSGITTKSMHSIQTNNYGVNNNDVGKHSSDRVQNSGESVYSQLLNYYENFDCVNQNNLLRNLSSRNTVLNTNVDENMSSMIRKKYQNTSTNGRKKSVAKKNVSKLTSEL